MNDHCGFDWQWQWPQQSKNIIRSECICGWILSHTAVVSFLFSSTSMIDESFCSFCIEPANWGHTSISEQAATSAFAKALSTQPQVKGKKPKMTGMRMYPLWPVPMVGKQRLQRNGTGKSSTSMKVYCCNYFDGNTATEPFSRNSWSIDSMAASVQTLSDDGAVPWSSVWLCVMLLRAKLSCPNPVLY